MPTDPSPPAQSDRELRLMSIIESAMDAIIAVDESQKVVMFNPAAERIFGVPAAQAMGSSLDRFIPERYRKAHSSHIRAFGQTGVTMRGMGRLGTLSGLRADGSEFPIEASISHAVAGGQRLYTVILRDVSERRKLEEQLLQAQKMEGIGRLAGGIAHDFNNLLMAIFNYIALANNRLDPQHPARAALSHAHEAAERAATLTRQLLAFARKQVVRPRVLSPRDTVTNLEPMLRRLVGDDLVLRTQAAADTGNVRADPTQLEQVVMNLVVNARDAMPDGGTLTIETSNVTLDDAACRTTPDCLPGAYIALTVTDTGVGMGPDVLSRLFEPFFTTKPPGKGTGLGLATCHGIIRQSGGYIMVESEPGRGTSIRVLLPRVQEQSALDESKPVHAPRGGHETILLVEDSGMIRDLMTEALGQRGYRVLVAANGRDAARIAEAHVGHIDLLISDVMMPEMSGVQLASLISRQHPRTRVILISGYAEENITESGLGPGAVFMSKPFSTDALLSQVRNVLDAPPPDAAAS